jgi:thiol:disulfide interchange protein
VANRFKQVEMQSERKGEIVMAENIKWETEMDAALVRARVEKKPVLLDFFNPG